jgi:hypothetical protein
MSNSGGSPSPLPQLSVRTSSNHLSPAWTLNWTFSSVQQNLWTLNWTFGSVLNSSGSKGGSEPNCGSTIRGAHFRCYPLGSPYIAEITSKRHHSCHYMSACHLLNKMGTSSLRMLGQARRFRRSIHGDNIFSADIVKELYRVTHTGEK